MTLTPLSHNDMLEMIDKFPVELINLSAESQQISVHIYRNLAHGQAVSPAQIAIELDIPFSTIVMFLEMSQSAVHFNSDGQIDGFLGLASSDNMPIRFKVNGKQLSTWCAWDALFIPPILQATAHIETQCPTTQETIKITVSPDNVSQVTPSTSVMSYVETDDDKLRKSVVNSFCHYVLFFSTPEAGEKWIADKSGPFRLLSIQDAFQLGQVKNKMQYLTVFVD